MSRKWLVVAVYQPPPKETVTYLRGVRSSVTVIPPHAGLEFKFTVFAEGTYEAITTVKGSNWFCGGIDRLFGFVASEMLR